MRAAAAAHLLEQQAAAAKEHTDKVSDIYRQLDGGDELEALLDYKCNRFCADKAQQPAFLTGDDWDLPEDDAEDQYEDYTDGRDPGDGLPDDDGESVATSKGPHHASKSGTQARDLASGRSVSGPVVTKYSQR